MEDNTSGEGELRLGADGQRMLDLNRTEQVSI